MVLMANQCHREGRNCWREAQHSQCPRLVIPASQLAINFPLTTQQYLQQCSEYDSRTGLLSWRSKFLWVLSHKSAYKGTGQSRVLPLQGPHKGSWYKPLSPTRSGWLPCLEPSKTLSSYNPDHHNTKKVVLVAFGSKSNSQQHPYERHFNIMHIHHSAVQHLH